MQPTDGKEDGGGEAVVSSADERLTERNIRSGRSKRGGRRRPTRKKNAAR
jgi:hypothetical protein